MRRFNLEEIVKWLAIGVVLSILAVKEPTLALLALVALAFLLN